MSIFDELADIYSDIDDEYAKIEAEARSRRHFIKEAKYSHKRELNDLAYFLFMFSRLEDRIKQLSNALIEDKYKNLTNWGHKRTWEILHGRIKNIAMLDRVALLTEKRKADYILVAKYYSQRNSIAHGQAFTIPISIATVVNDMKRLYNDLA